MGGAAPGVLWVLRPPPATLLHSHLGSTLAAAATPPPSPARLSGAAGQGSGLHPPGLGPVLPADLQPGTLGLGICCPLCLACRVCLPPAEGPSHPSSPPHTVLLPPPRAWHCGRAMTPRFTRCGLFQGPTDPRMPLCCLRGDCSVEGRGGRLSYAAGGGGAGARSPSCTPCLPRAVKVCLGLLCRGGSRGSGAAACLGLTAPGGEAAPG